MSSQQWHAYLFKADGIQSYILEGGRLRDMVAASEMLEQLLAESSEDQSNVLDQTLAACNIDEQNAVCRRAGGVLSLVHRNEENVRQFAALWSLLVQQYLPGLAFSQAISVADNIVTAIDNSYKELNSKPPAAPALPIAGPLVERAARTGTAAVDYRKISDSTENLSASLHAKHKFFEHSKTRQYQLEAKFHPKNTDYKFPTDFDAGDFDFGPTRDIALIHADGNGIGQLVKKIGAMLREIDQRDQFVQESRRFSNELAEIAKQATQAAVKHVAALYTPSNEEKYGNSLPLRPIVLGGDDLSLLIRADLAMPFVQTFLQTFEQHKAILGNHKKLKAEFAKTPLTACAGVVFIKYNQPFTRAYRLAESCCDHAKHIARSIDADGPMPSCAVFHRVTSSFMDEYSDVLDRELTVGPANNRTRMTMGAYGTGKYAKDLPSLDSLLRIVSLLKRDSLRRGPLRGMLSNWVSNPDQAARQYQNWCRQLNNNCESKQALDEFKKLAADLLLVVSDDHFPQQSFKADTDEPQSRTALLDLLNLRAVEGYTDD